MRWPSTSTSAGNGAAPLPSRTMVLAMSVRFIVPSLNELTIALPRRLQRHLPELVDDEAHAIARGRELRLDAAAGHHDNAGLGLGADPWPSTPSPHARGRRGATR